MNQPPAAKLSPAPRGNVASFWWIAAGVTVILALFLSPLASQAPDGLEASQQTLRMPETTDTTATATAATPNTLNTPSPHGAPMPDYKLAAVASPYWSTGLAGLIGAAGVFLITTGLVRLVARKSPPAPAQPPPPTTTPATPATDPLHCPEAQPAMTTPAWNPVFAGDLAPAETTFSEPPPPRRFLARLDPRAQVLFCLAILATVVTTPAHQLAAFLGYAVLLTGLFALAGAAPRAILRRISQFLPLLLLLALPILLAPMLAPDIAASPAAPSLQSELTPIDRLAGWLALPPSTLWLAWNMAGKALLGFSTILLLQTLLPFEPLLSALDRLHAPRLLTTLLQLTHRYTSVLGEEAERMNRARTARGGSSARARWVWQALPAGHLIGSLFVRSLDRGERVHQAMLARGFDGVALTGRRDDLTPAAWQAADTLALLALAAVLVALRVSSL